MEMNRFDAVVVSAFGRGHWLASELNREKMRVLLVDVTSRLGVWPVEDAEGPFGAVKIDSFENTFLERLNNDDPIENAENGWTFWFPDGPFEFKGPLAKFHAERLRWPDHWLEIFARGGRVSELDLDSGDFLRTWPLALSHQLGATRYLPAARALEAGRPIPFAASFGVRQATRQGLTRNLDWLREKGVVVTDKTEVLDVSFKSRREIMGLELKGDPGGLVRADLFVWTLTGGETRFLSPKLAEALYPGGVVDPSWCWIRYRLSVAREPEVARLPLHTVLIEDLEYPWAHSNVVILGKTTAEERLDAWIRIPALQRFNRDYLAEHGRRIVEKLQRRMPTSKPEMQSLPQEASYTSQELGEPRVPLWDLQPSPAAGRRRAGNLFFESPENRENHTLDCEFDHQRALRDRAMQWWKQRQQKQQQKEKTT